MSNTLGTSPKEERRDQYMGMKGSVGKVAERCRQTPLPRGEVLRTCHVRTSISSVHVQPIKEVLRVRERRDQVKGLTKLASHS